jgi:hypothetical protein
MDFRVKLKDLERNNERDLKKSGKGKKNGEEGV